MKALCHNPHPAAAVRFAHIDQRQRFRILIVGAALRNSRVRLHAVPATATAEYASLQISMDVLGLRVEELVLTLQKEMATSELLKQRRAPNSSLLKMTTPQWRCSSSEADWQRCRRLSVVRLVSRPATQKSDADLLDAIQKLFSETIDLGSAVKAVAAISEQLAGQSLARPSCACVQGAGSTVLRVAKSLQEQRRESEGEKGRQAASHSVDVDRDLSGPQLKHHSAVWTTLKAAKSACKSCRWIMWCHFLCLYAPRW